MLTRRDFYFDLPAAQIAQYPLPERSASRLLTLNGATGELTDRQFTDLPALLHPGDLLIFNATRVLPARLMARKATGGRVEILIERLLSSHTALAHLRANKPLRPATRLQLVTGERHDWLLVGERHDDLFELQALTVDFADLMQRAGQVPLPPYIHRPPEASDVERYQTVYAKHAGAVAAPTAGLHFDAALLARLREDGVNFGEVTLHVGAGTFQPVRVEQLDQHQMHREWLEVTAAVCAQVEQTKAAGRRVIAVGTTAVRSLETAAAVTGQLQPYRGDTQLFIRPGDPFRVVDALMTNFHVPESTLLMLVAAFGGYAAVMAAYRHAVASGYRFFSYGDAMFLTPAAARSTADQ
ncbi:tRNA preQ1(34) S-adenosylmethionine ribosyltransferase-isomerase QueA [Rhodopseudomonas palustris]|uniref:S-adenosylmethionine:tRNA ribosyltransferase-isomerase n=1 Tax=Thiospirillum jenense TaxID=1653858 RepID=A0A839HKG0_9GAMM|nr:tRNA preQ1(34) S-adenosylmethionine ribosyltransferase-isomerase QueA [Thiospirillum jenense]MBB1093064.1 tRNA preQ1(34) S-adenosylmethionine ribosyltransferase-isomerase QueA [Rhodopseudomonas palustris]MBB1127137.1 tRNA preQ1(34) S-adenosylmethionine ribosyltransferase-isomerase QueA [Thiospirillum jenense]